MRYFHIQPFDVQVGDRILGTDLIVAERAHYESSITVGGTEMSSTNASPLGAWSFNLTNGRTMKYFGDSKLTVLRKEEND